MSGIKLLLLLVAIADEDEVMLAKDDKSAVEDGKMDIVSVNEGITMLDTSNVLDEDVTEVTMALAVILGSTEDVTLNVLVSSVEEAISDVVIVADGLAEDEARLSLEMAVADDRNSVDEVGGRVATVLDSTSCVVVVAAAVSLVLLIGFEGVADDAEAVLESVGKTRVLVSVVEVTIALFVVDERIAVSVVEAVLLSVLDSTALSVLDGAMLCVVEMAVLSVVEEGGGKLFVVEAMMLSDDDVTMLSVVEGAALSVVGVTAPLVVDVMALSLVGTMMLLVVDAIILSVVDVMALSLVGIALLSVVEMTVPVSVLDAALLSAVVDTILSVTGAEEEVI